MVRVSFGSHYSWGPCFFARIFFSRAFRASCLAARSCRTCRLRPAQRCNHTMERQQPWRNGVIKIEYHRILQHILEYYKTLSPAVFYFSSVRDTTASSTAATAGTSRYQQEQMAKHNHLPGLVAANLNLPGFYDQNIGVDDLSKKDVNMCDVNQDMCGYEPTYYIILYIYIYPAIYLLISPLDPQLKPQCFAKKSQLKPVPVLKKCHPTSHCHKFPENLTVFTGKTHISSGFFYTHKQPNCNHQPTIMNLNSIDPHLMVKTL